MDITVIIPTYNRSYKILHVLRALDNQKHEDFNYVVRVMDDGSTDNTKDILASFEPKNYKFYWYTQQNTGPGEARNKLISTVDTELVLITGDDIVPTYNFLDVHHKTHLIKADEKLAVLGYTSWFTEAPITTVMKHIDGMGAQQFSYFYLKDNQYYDYRHFYTSNISIRTNFIKSLNVIFKSEFTNAAFEDIEAGLRLEKMGMKILYNKSAVAYHDHFYSARAFCRRQYNVGLAAKVIVGFHPEMANIIGFDEIDKFKKIAISKEGKKINFEFNNLLQSSICLEEHVLRLVSSYESKYVYPLDDMYLELFKYFYYKGIVSAEYDDNLDQINITLIRLILWPATQNFYKKLVENEIVIPKEEFNVYLNASNLFINNES
jgi:glycosyltransferase involved in cell wall biosynthesis